MCLSTKVNDNQILFVFVCLFIPFSAIGRSLYLRSEEQKKGKGYIFIHSRVKNYVGSAIRSWYDSEMLIFVCCGFRLLYEREISGCRDIELSMSLRLGYFKLCYSWLSVEIKEHNGWEPHYKFNVCLCFWGKGDFLEGT